MRFHDYGYTNVVFGAAKGVLTSGVREDETLTSDLGRVYARVQQSSHSTCNKLLAIVRPHGMYICKYT